jgi:capsular exopolysaccharide synthesis family protein
LGAAAADDSVTADLIRGGELGRRRLERGSGARLIEAPLEAAPPPILVPQGVTLAELFGTIWRRRWIIVAIVLPLTVAGFVVAKLLPADYTAEGALIIASRKFMIPELQTISTPTGDVAIVRSEMSVLRSRTLLREVAQKLHLEQVPEFNSRLRPKDDDLLHRLDPRPYINALFAPKSTRAPDESELVAAEVENTLNKDLSVGNDNRDYVITVQYTGRDPVLSAQIVNTLMASYIEQYVESKVSATVSANASLNARAEELRRDIAAADDAVKQFTLRTGVLETRLGSVSSQQLNDLNAELATAHADRAAAEARYEQARSLQNEGGAGATSKEVLNSQLIQNLRQTEDQLSRDLTELSSRLTANHPDVVQARKQLAAVRASIARETGRTVESLRGQVEIARTREETLAKRIAQLGQTARASADDQAELQRLKDDADGKRKVYNEFLVRIAETAKPNDRQEADARIISNAVAPIGPSGPHAFLFALVAGVLGTLASVAGILMHREIDHGFETLGQVRTSTGLLGFAVLPTIRRRGARFHRYVLDEPYSALAEAIRGFRARLRAVAQYRPAKTILVCSAASGEGKTSFALALARLSARDGLKVLLIDGDLRRPTLRAMLPPTSESQLADILAGRVPWRSGVCTDRASGLDYLTVRESVHNVSQLLESDAFERILREAAAEYDFVILDSSPIMRVTDATLLARHVDVIALIVSWKKTQRRVVAEACRRLDMVHPDTLCGIVLNRAEHGRVKHDSYTGYAH